MPASQEDIAYSPSWSSLIALLAVGGLYAALPANLAIGPRWFALVLIIGIELPLLITHQTGRFQANKILAHVLAATLTLMLLWSLTLLVRDVPSKREEPIALLRSAVALWITNVLIFASWYWRLDAGGPHLRSLRPNHEDGAFLFPQMTLQDQNGEQPVWQPQFIDYLFLSFNTSTAFSPTDAPILSRWAKVLVMIQSSISLTVVVILAARAINIL